MKGLRLSGLPFRWTEVFTEDTLGYNFREGSEVYDNTLLRNSKKLNKRLLKGQVRKVGMLASYSTAKTHPTQMRQKIPPPFSGEIVQKRAPMAPVFHSLSTLLYSCSPLASERWEAFVDVSLSSNLERPSECFSLLLTSSRLSGSGVK